MNRTSFTAMLAIAAVLVVLVGYIEQTEANKPPTTSESMEQIYVNTVKKDFHRKIDNTKKVFKNLAHGKFSSS